MLRNAISIVCMIVLSTINIGAQTKGVDKASNKPILTGLKSYSQIVVPAKANPDEPFFTFDPGITWNVKGDYRPIHAFYNGKDIMVSCMDETGAREVYESLETKLPKLSVGSILLMGEHDFDADGNNEIVVALKSGANIKINLFRCVSFIGESRHWVFSGSAGTTGVGIVRDKSIIFPNGTAFGYFENELMDENDHVFARLLGKMRDKVKQVATSKHPSSSILEMLLYDRTRTIVDNNRIDVKDIYSIRMKGNFMGVNVYNMRLTVAGTTYRQYGEEEQYLIGDVDVKEHKE